MPPIRIPAYFFRCVNGYRYECMCPVACLQLNRGRPEVNEILHRHLLYLLSFSSLMIIERKRVGL